LSEASVNGEKGRFYDRMAGQADWDSWTNRWETNRRLRLVFDQLLGEESGRKAAPRWRQWRRPLLP
jgi:hypothetical protein